MHECIVIVSGYINNQEKVDAYKNIAGPVMKKYGATLPPKSYKVDNILAGKPTPSFFLNITFSDIKNAIAAFNDEDYKAAIKDRDEGFGDLSIFIAD